MNVLVVAPHPDDETLGCGGTIARHADEGDTVWVFFMTRGDASYDQEWIRESRDEARRAVDSLGGNWMFFDFPSPSLDTVPFSRIINALALEMPVDIAYIPDRNDLHQEHRLVHEAACVAFRTVPNLYAYETLSETECGFGFVPNHYVAIDWQRKRAALAEYRTQLNSRRSLEACEALARVRGQAAGCEYAEAFRTIRTFRGAS